MKNIFFFFLGTVIFAGCGNKDKILLDQVPATPIVNPATSVFIKNNVLLTARLDSGNIIRGITRNNAFKTTDYFSHFGFTTYAMPSGTYDFDKDTVAFGSGDPLSPVLNYSADYGYHWISFPPVLSPALSNTGYYSTKLADINYPGGQTLLLLYVQQPTTGGYTRKIYKVNTTTQQGALLCNLQDNYEAVSIKFMDENTGWMLLSNAGAYLCKTTNGGATWSTPVLIDTRTDLSVLELASNGILSVYKPMGGACFSIDGGATWKKANSNLLFYDVQAVNATTLYALTNTGLAKSADGGQNWDLISGYGTGFSNVLKLFFQDEQKGMVYADQRLFMTQDGGKSWQTLLYPYAYVTQ